MIVFTSTAGATKAQSFVPSEWTLIAHYPLTVSVDDTTGNNGPLETKSAPFENGGLFLNGIGTHFLELDFSVAETPSLAALNFEAFAMTTEFNTDSLHTNPLLVGGTFFYGTVRNLKVYTEAPIGIGIDTRDEVPTPKVLLSVYPDPAGGSESISVSSATDVSARISLVDVLGRLVWSPGTIQLNVGANRLPRLPHGLRNGLYFVRVEAGDRTETRSLIIAR